MRPKLFRHSVQLFASLLLAVQLMPLAIKGAPSSKLRPGKIKGQISDINQARVFNAIVNVDGFETYRQLVTDENGEFEVSLLPGVYRISVDAVGFRPFVSDETEVKAGKTRTVKIQLKVAASVMPVPAAAGSD